MIESATHSVESKFVAGCPHATNRLFSHHRPALLRVARRILRHEHDAEDAVQSGLQRAWQAHHTLKDPSKVAGWLRCIVRYRAIELLRRKQIRPLQAQHPDTPASNDIEQDLDLRQLQTDLKTAIDTLTPSQRDVFVLRTTTLMNYDEVAHVIGCSPGSARVHYSNAAKRVRDTLEQGARGA